MTKHLTFFLLLLIDTTAFAQPVMRWQKNYGGSNNEVVNSIQPTSDGGYIVAGATYSANGDVTLNRGKADFWVAKLDTAGTIIWQKTYGGSGWDVAKCIKPTSDGGYIVVGYTNSYDGNITGRIREAGTTYNYYDSWVLKLNATGAITWSTCLYAATYSLNPSINGSANTVIQATDGSYIVGGMRQINRQDPNDIGDYQISKIYSWTLKLSNLGYVIWQSKQLIGGGTGFPYTSFQDSIGVTSIVQVGNNFTVLSSGLRIWAPMPTCVTSTYAAKDVSVLHLNGLTGASLWQKCYSANEVPGVPQNTAAADLQKTSDGGYIIAGNSQATTGCFTGAGNHGGDDFCVIKINSTGGLQWARCYGGSNRDVAKSIYQSADGNYYVGGYSYSSDGQVTDHIHYAPTTADYWVVKINSLGNLLWSKSFGGTGDDLGMAMAKTTNGRYVIAGSSTSSYSTILNKGGTDWLLINFDDCNILPPAAPTTQNFLRCTFSPPRVSSLAATGTNIKWYNSATGTTPLTSSSLLPLGTYYYWVSQTSATGCESARTLVKITVTVSVSCRAISQQVQNNIVTDNTAGPVIFPNPNNGSFKLNLAVDISVKNVRIEMTDVYGKIVLSKNYIANKGVVQETIHAENLASGTYFIKYAAVEKINAVKIVINK